MSTENQEDVCETMPKFSRTKEKHNAKNNHIFYIVSNKINHLAFKKIWSEITRAVGIYDDPKNKCGHYLKTSHSLPCACELITRIDHVFPIQLHGIDVFWQTLEIGGPHPSTRQQDMDSEMRSLTDLLHQISTRLISKVREMRRLTKGVLNPVLPEDPGVTLTSPPEKSSGSVSGSGTRSGSLLGSGSGSGSRGRGRPPRAPRERGRGRDRGRSNFSALNDMCPIPPLHVQWIHHRSEWVSNWADSYQHRIADWNARVARNRK
ncbi:hypothetical protein M9H77_35465 [Catharanthus roseus]|uniref:Uncharacterized protein n=1 Tax=Catharanthus roseus TaxID=4058 RepID=A0ACB9ZPD7_CATRO|nr:hypothetical protein M9H77_35465 [Catharanthus roseus]